MEYVMAVHRFGHFAKAADYCNVTQPTLSSMIQKLEDELGVKIFDRRKQPIRPTPAGKIIIDRAWGVLVRARRLKEVAQEQKQSLTGTFHLGVLPTIAPYLIPRFLPQLMSDYPDIDLRVTELKTEEMQQALRRNDIDAGILAMVEGLDNFDCHHLFYEKFYAYVAKDNDLFDRTAIRTADLTGEYLWLLDEGHCFREQLVKFCQLKAAANSKKTYHLGSIETFMRIVESGKGVTFIPELATYQLSDGQKQLVKPFAHPIPTRDIVLMTSRNFIRNSLRELIAGKIRQSVPTEMLELRETQRTV